MNEYNLIRSKRKTIALYIRGGVLEVRAPLRASLRDIEQFIVSKEKWISKNLAHSQEQARRRENFCVDYGDTVLYLGCEYPIIAKTGRRVGFDDGFFMPPGLSHGEIKSACIQIYRRLARRDLPSRVLYFSKKMAVSPAAVKISGAKTRWGSCSTRRNLNFSWRLIMAGIDVVDYVVVHELAHLLEMNHSPRFWEIVAAVLPDYRERRGRLKALNERLAREDW